MKRHPVRQALVGLAAVVSFVLALSAPAASQPVLGGDLHVGGTPSSPTFTIPLAGPVSPPCVPELNYVDPFFFDETKVDGAGNGMWEMDGGFATIFLLLGTWVKLELDFSDFDGTSAPSGTPGIKDLTGGGELVMSISLVTLPTDPEDPCIKDELACTVTGDMVLGFPSTYDGPQPPGPPGVLDLNIDTIAPHFQASLLNCTFIFWFLFNGQPGYIRDLIIEL